MPQSETNPTRMPRVPTQILFQPERCLIDESAWPAPFILFCSQGKSSKGDAPFGDCHRGAGFKIAHSYCFNLLNDTCDLFAFHSFDPNPNYGWEQRSGERQQPMKVCISRYDHSVPFSAFLPDCRISGRRHSDIANMLRLDSYFPKVFDCRAR